MIEQYPVTPPPELVAQIRSDALRKCSDVLDYELRMIHAAYRAGADQELEACCEWAAEVDRDLDKELRAARRPKPPTRLAKEALTEIEQMEGAMYSADLGCDFTATRRALERLHELEQLDE